MKKITLFLLVILSYSVLAQNGEPQTLKFYYKDTTKKYLTEHTDFSMNNFMLNWHWYCGKSLSKALGMTNGHFTIDDPYSPHKYLISSELDLLADSVKMIINSARIRGWSGIFSPAYSMAYQYEPTLLINPNDPNRANQRPGDSSNPIFGFLNIKGIISTNPSDVNYSRLQLEKTSFINETVLSTPYPSTILKNWGTDRTGIYIDPLNQGDTTKKLYEREVNGEEFYLTINLRRLDSTDILKDNMTVLTLKMPYVAGGGLYTGLIKFDSLPSVNYGDTVSLLDNRGKARTLYCPNDFDVNFYDSINITRNMIPIGSESNRDVTISCHFKLNNKSNYYDGNFALKNFKSTIPYIPIDSLKIEAIYRGKSSIGIQYIRIENRPARELLRGQWDNALSNKLQMDIDTITKNTAWVNKGLKPFRWYLVDEPGFDLSFFWFAHRYYNQRFGNVFTTEGGDGNNFFNYYVKNQEHWNSLGAISAWHTSPYFRRNIFDDDDITAKNLNLGGGYNSFYGDISPADTFKLMFNSHYETIQGHKESGVDKYDFNWYEINKISPLTFGDHGHGTQMDIERHDFGLYDTLTNQFLYDSIRWQAQTWNDMRFFFVKNQPMLTRVNGGLSRIQTGEEFRYFFMKDIIFGSKGFVLDGEPQYYPDKGVLYDTVDGTAFNLHRGQDVINSSGLTSSPAWDLLSSDSIGGDFLLRDTTKELFSKFINMDTVSKYLTIDKDRFYVGRKSVRREFFKISNFIKHNEALIMNLQFLAAYHKGFRKLYTQDPKITTSNYLSNFVDIYSIKTKPYQRSYYENTTYDSLGYKIDSGFYQITLLQDKRKSRDSVFYIGVINKRMNPNILLDPSEAGGSRTDSIAFFSTAELEDSIQNHPTIWSKYYYKRLGTRDMSLKFNYTNTLNDRYNLLHITEVGMEDTTYSYLPWKSKAYNQVIDTIVGQDKEILLTLLPGQGKLLRVEVIQSSTSIDGDLNFSNQTKLISHPVANSLGVQSDSVYRMHLVYQKRNPTTYNDEVYYVRSKPIVKGVRENDNIVWENPIYVSSLIKCNCDPSDDNNPSLNTTHPNPPCSFPAMIVRFDSVAMKNVVYMVFRCFLESASQEGGCPGLYPNQKLFVTEAKINADDTIQSLLPPRVLDFAIGTYEDTTFVGEKKWGIPMINACDSGNYYIWTNQGIGLKAGFKRPYDFCFVPQNKVSFKYYAGVSQALHPSLNPYSSRYSLNPNTADVVWTESPDNGTSGTIFYSKLKMTPLGIRIFLSDSMKSKYPWETYNMDSTIWKLSYGGYLNTLPVIYRGTEEGIGRPPIDINMVAWEDYDNSWGAKCGTDSVNDGCVKIRRIYNDQVNFEFPSIAGIIYPSNASLYHPNLSQGAFTPGATSPYNYYNQNSRAWMLTYQFNYGCDILSKLNTKMLSMNLNYDTYLSMSYNDFKFLNSKGQLPHLAQRPYIKDNSDWEWEQNRIVYNSNNSNPSLTNNEIRSSSQYFFRKTAEETINPIVFVGFSDTTNQSQIAKITINDQVLDFDLNYLFPKENNRNNRNLDTIPTKWFTLNNNGVMNILLFGIDTNQINIQIQKRSTGETYQASLNNWTNENISAMSLNLVNADNDDYRLLLLRRNNNVFYTENIVLTSTIDSVEYYAKKTECLQTIDLGNMKNISNEITGIQLSLFPNPAKEKVYATAYLPVSSYTDGRGKTNITIKLFNNLGKELFKQIVKPGETISIPTDIYNQGVYFIRAEENTPWGFDVITPITTPFIIER